MSIEEKKQALKDELGPKTLHAQTLSDIIDSSSKDIINLAYASMLSRVDYKKTIYLLGGNNPKTNPY